jgi:hypothetical protein
MLHFACDEQYLFFSSGNLLMPSTQDKRTESVMTKFLVTYHTYRILGLFSNAKLSEFLKLQ